MSQSCNLQLEVEAQSWRMDSEATLVVVYYTSSMAEEV